MLSSQSDRWTPAMTREDGQANGVPAKLVDLAAWFRNDQYGWSAGKKGLVDLANAAGHRLVAELFDEPLASSSSESFAERGVRHQFTKGVRQFIDRLAREQVSGLSRNHDFAGSVDVIAAHRFAGDQRLGEHAGQSLPETGMHDHVGRLDQLRDLLGRNEAGEHERIAQPGFFDLTLELRAENAVPHKQKTDVGMFAC